MNTELNKIAFLASSDLTGAEIALRGIPNDDPKGCFSDVVIGRIKSGVAKLCEIVDGTEKIGYTVYEIQEFPGHREFVSVATFAPTAHPLRYELENLLKELAIREKCQSMRLHTVRPGLVKSALSRGWHVAEIVLRKSLT